MAITLDQHLQMCEDARRAAEELVQDATRRFKRCAASIDAAGGEARVDQRTLNRADALAREVREAKDTQRKAEGALEAARALAGEEAEYQRKAAESYETEAGRRSRERSGPVREERIGVMQGMGGLVPGGWVYRDSGHAGRPAAVAGDQSVADHGVFREVSEARARQDQAVEGYHGSLGGLIRAMTTSSGSAVVPTTWSASIIDRARNLAAVTQAGAQVIPMPSKVVQIGRLTGDPTASFRAEGSTITASDPTLDNVTLTATTLSALVVGSVEWWQDSTAGGGADEIVHEALAKQIALAIDLAALFGGVTTGQEQGGTGNNLLPSGGLPNPPNPRGILATLLAVASSSVLGGAINGTVPTTYAELLDLIYTPRDNNEAPNALLWPSRLARKYAKLLDSQNNPMRVPPDVQNITRYVTNQIPSGMTQGTGTTMADAFVGDFTQLLIGQRLDLTVQPLGELYAATGQRGVLCTWRGDIAPARPRAFAVYRYLQGV